MAGNPPGRPPKPPTLKLIEGNRGKRKQPNAPTPSGRKPRSPGYKANTHEARAWTKLVADLEDLRLLTATDQEAMRRYCDLSGIYARARADVRKRGHLVPGRDKGTRVTNPSWRVMRDAHKELMGLEVQFGKLPSARGRMDLPPALSDDEAAAVFS